jgi:hypothetical protein
MEDSIPSSLGAVGVDDRGQILDHEESSDLPVAEVENGGVVALRDGDAALLDFNALLAKSDDARAGTEELERFLLPSVRR